MIDVGEGYIKKGCKEGAESRERADGLGLES